MLTDETGGLIHSDPEILGGTPVFAGTRVPVQTLFDYLEEGHALDEFLDDFPTVKPDQARRVIGLSGRRLVGEAELVAA